MNHSSLLSILRMKSRGDCLKKNLLFVIKEGDVDEVYNVISFFFHKHNIMRFQAPDNEVFSSIGQTPASAINRLSVLSEVSKESDNNILLTTVEAIARLVPDRDFVRSNALSLSVGTSFKMELLISELVRLGYSRCVNAFHQGEFAVRGSIVDIVYALPNSGVRIDFFGDRVESLRSFDVASQASVGRVSEIIVGPCREWVADDITKRRLAESVRARFGLRYEDFIAGLDADIVPLGCDDLLPLFHVKLISLFDYLDKNSWTIECDSSFLSESVAFFDKLKAKYNEYGSLLNDLPLINLDELYENEKLLEMRALEFSGLSDKEADLDKGAISIITSLDNEARFKGKGKFEVLLERLTSDKRDGEVFVICCSSQASVVKMKSILLEHDIISESVDSYELLRKPPIKNFTYITVFQIDMSFMHKNIIFISESDLIGEKLVKERRGAKRDSAEFLFSDLNALNVGDIVVHIEHGIGVFEGLETISVLKVAHDFVKIGYDGGDKFYLPVESLDLLTKYGSFEHSVKLDKLGAASWQARKAKLRNRIKVAAEALLKIAAARNQANLPIIEPDRELYAQFVNSFPYIETEDQSRAIDDVLSDLLSGRPMDRLICGDVGFGKTEVALRAAFAVASSEHKYQVAVLVPTTLLSRQHKDTFIKRFKDIPLNIKELSKFTNRSEIKSIKEGIKSGDVDIVIGTHALLAKDINFKNLGLIIIDEEQHFGVAQKEKLKHIKSSAHVLTLSATPIPRTLQMSLFGIRDLSIIATPPVNRLPIKTYVAPSDLFAIREGILRELERGGRVFYITPRIKYIDGIIDQLKKAVPEARFVAAHGSMSASELDSIMNEFFDGKYNVLVSTTIIESGLDIPDANTIIIDRAQYFGLSQLHQIRGRVGRSNKQAYAYITYPRGMKLSAISEQRLSIIQSVDSLGGGFTVATHDMDLRGHGNILGDDQSGHVKEVGIELYQQMLEEAVNALKLDDSESLDKDWSPIINLGISIQIPDEYIPDLSLRINLYRRIANTSSKDEILALSEEMTDRFGLIPDPVMNLIAVVQIKHKAKRANIERLDLSDDGIVISFKDEKAAYPELVLDFINKNFMHSKFKGGKKLIVSLKCLNGSDVFAKAEFLIDSLCA